jgi:hypothetical protein
MHGHVLLQFVDEGAASSAAFRRIGTRDAVDEFRQRDGRHADFGFTETLSEGIQKLFDGLMLPLRVDHETGIED